MPFLKCSQTPFPIVLSSFSPTFSYHPWALHEILASASVLILARYLPRDLAYFQRCKLSAGLDSFLRSQTGSRLYQIQLGGDTTDF